MPYGREQNAKIPYTRELTSMASLRNPKYSVDCLPSSQSLASIERCLACCIAIGLGLGKRLFIYTFSDIFVLYLLFDFVFPSAKTHSLSKLYVDMLNNCEGPTAIPLPFN